MVTDAVQICPVIQFGGEICNLPVVIDDDRCKYHEGLSIAFDPTVGLKRCAHLAPPMKG